MKPTYSYRYDQGLCSICGIEVHTLQQAIHDDMHRKLEDLTTEIGILKATLSGLSSVAGPMGPPGYEGPAGKDAVGSEMFMKCPECMSTIHVKDEAAHMKWHDMIDDLFEDNQIPMIEEDPSGPPPKAPTYVTTTYGGSSVLHIDPTTTGTYTVNSGSSSFAPIDYSPKTA